MWTVTPMSDGLPSQAGVFVLPDPPRNKDVTTSVRVRGSFLGKESLHYRKKPHTKTTL